MSAAIIAQGILALAGTMLAGSVGAYLMHLRLTPKSKAEARDITAAAMDKDWLRFQREINRLVKRLEEAEAASERAIKGQRECEAREAKANARILNLEAVIAARGEIRSRAHEVVAADRLEQRKGGE